jgi:2-polyprenyl-3-methyl-5-hydroxy-6-metoxy-1,4-benzoquinol methylase
MPIQEDIALAYAKYYTHEQKPSRRRALRGLVEAAKEGYLANSWGYGRAVRLPQRILGWLAFLYPGKRAEYDFSVMWLRSDRKGRLLDIGAGSGDFVARMRGLGWSAEGLDFDPRSVDNARARGLTFHLGDLASQGFRDEAFNAITMSHSLEHVHDPIALLREARRLLVKPGGQLAIATPNTGSVLHRKFGQHWFALEPPRHLHLFSRQSLALALRKAGFERFSIFATVRDVNGSWRGSRSIRHSGRYDMLAAPSPGMSFLGRAVQLSVAVRRLWDQDAGEELVALAEV